MIQKSNTNGTKTQARRQVCAWKLPALGLSGEPCRFTVPRVFPVLVCGNISDSRRVWQSRDADAASGAIRQALVCVFKTSACTIAVAIFLRVRF